MGTNFPTPFEAGLVRNEGWPKWLKILLWTLAFGVLWIVVIAGMGLFFEYTAKSVPVTEADKLVLLEAQELADWAKDEDFEPQTELGNYAKQRYIDGSYDLEYEYEDTEGVYLYNLHTVERKASDAMSGYNVCKTAATLSLESEGGSVDQRDELLSWGDHSEFYILELDGEPYGMAFFGRKRKRYVQVIVSGYYSDDKEDVETLFRLSLDAFDAYKP